MKITAEVTQSFGASVFQRIDRALDLLQRWIDSRIPTIKKGLMFMFILPDTQPDVPFSISLPTVQDAKGVTIPNEKLTVAVVSDNPDAVAVTLNPDNVSGHISIGKPGLANVNATITDTASGLLLDSFGAQFTIQTSGAAKATGGGIAFTGITEAPAPPAP